MVLCIASSCWANGFYQLPDAIAFSWIVLLWCGLWYVWQTQPFWNVLCGCCNLVVTNYLEPYLVTVFPLWSTWVVLAQFNVLEASAICKIKFEARCIITQQALFFWTSRANTFFAAIFELSMPQLHRNDILNLFSKITPRRAWNMTKVWSSYQLSRFLKKPVQWGYPISISFEPTTSCNLRCPECPSGLREFTRPTGMLQKSFFEQTIDDIHKDLLYLIFYFQV